jgi:hypothetical protein
MTGILRIAKESIETRAGDTYACTYLEMLVDGGKHGTEK